MSEHDLDLYWHALNYRTAATLPEATAMWHELHACVERLIANGDVRPIDVDDEWMGKTAQ